jgi:hypothetical protein
VQLIYCIDKAYTDNLISKGFELLGKSIVDTKECWILKPSLNLKFDYKNLNQKLCFFSNKLMF